MLQKKWLAAGLLLASTALGACSLPGLVRPALQPTLASAPVPTAVPSAVSQPPAISSGALAPFQSLLEQIYAQVSPSVVAIRVVVAPEEEALGSGFVWDSSGDLVTNNHVVEGAKSITVIFADGTTTPARVVGTDPDSDLAVLRVNVPAAMLRPVVLADSSQVMVGQVTIAIGNPFGEQNTMTQGIVSALGRQLPVSSSGSGSQAGSYLIPDVIQTDAAINPGNSGGVLLDDQGRVIGVTTAIVSAAGSSAGVGFAIPSNIVSRVVPSLIKTGRFLHPYLGISGTDMTPDLAGAMGLSPLTRGALVESVTSGGPASKAGVRGSRQRVTMEGQTVGIGGDVILAVDGTPIKSMADLIAYTADNTQVGQTISLTVLRGGKQAQLSLTLEARPVGSQTASVTTGAASLGIQGESLNADLAQAMGLSADEQGVLILEVTPGGPAQRAGLRGGDHAVSIGGVSTPIGGDVIVGIDGQPVASSADLQALLAQDAPGQTVRVFILRSGGQRSVEVTLGAEP